MMYYFRIPGEPTGKARPRVVRGHSYTPEKTVLYENLVKTCYRGPVYIGPVEVQITACFQVPKSVSASKRERMLSGEIPPVKRPDCDNIGKIICDALNYTAYGDDAQVVRLSVRKVWGTVGEVQVGIREWGGDEDA